jgi:hypothetical protein
MTTNQRHAAALAAGVCRGAISPAALSDEEWSLLLLAAGMNAVAARPATVARRALKCARRESGYFRRVTPPPGAAREPRVEPHRAPDMN